MNWWFHVWRQLSNLRLQLTRTSIKSATLDIDRKYVEIIKMCLWDKILVSSRVSSGVEMRVVVVLALLFWGFSHEVEGGRATSISKEEDLELERELRRLNKPTIKSFHARNSFLEFYMLYILPLISVLIWKNIVL